MVKIHKFSLLVMILLCTIISISLVKADISLGTAQTGNSDSVLAGESSRFKILLFNAHDVEDLYISIGHESPEDWLVEISPNNFFLPYREIGNKTNEEGFEIIGTGVDDVKAKPVWININVPEKEKKGTYFVKININSRKQGSGVSMTQSRSYRYTINVVKKYDDEDDDEQEENENDELEKNVKPKQPTETPEINIQNRTEDEETLEIIKDYEDGTNGLTGMIINNPLITPIVLGVVVLVFMILRLFKRI